jgi:hypothetical protein
MGFSKGDPRINREGRKPNTNHAKLRKAISEGLDLDTLWADLDELSPRDRVNATLKLMEFILPKLSSVQTQEKNLKELVSEMTRDESAELIDTIIEHYGEA